MGDLENETTPLLAHSPRPSEKASQSHSADDCDTNILPDRFPSLQFTQKRVFGGKQLPQCIAHRGFKAKYPENTMHAFRGAVEEGLADAIETDIHLTKDGVVVLSHDPDLKRCFGRSERVIDCNWSYLKDLRTLRAPHVPMPRLKDLLEYLAQPGLEHIWIMLDIKLDNDSDKVMRLIAETIASVPPSSRPWSTRVVLGIWAAKYLPLCVKYLPGFPVTYIGISTYYARQFLKVPNVGFNMFARLLIGPIGNKFIADVHKQHRALYGWTINDKTTMKFAIAKKFDGVITDDPKVFNEICLEDTGEGQEVHLSLYMQMWTLWFSLLVTLFSIPLRHRFAGSADNFLQTEKLKMRTSLVAGA